MAIEALLQRAASGTINVRRFDLAGNRRFELAYGLDAAAAEAVVLEAAASGWNSIVNETIDIHDGGVSGVAFGDVIEFAPDDTPQGVHRPGICSLPRELGLRVLEKVYGFRPAINYEPNVRVEFSIHPMRIGIRNDHTIVWELERFPTAGPAPQGRWPNRFSELLGDKLFGLVLADQAGLPVPRTTAITRRVGTFRFGLTTTSLERWIRTCPPRPVPGFFPTFRGWKDPFVLMQGTDPHPGTSSLASVLDQRDVSAAYSGVAESRNELVELEGVQGSGDRFMLGQQEPQELPSRIVDDVRALHRKAVQKLGPIRMEWAHDGRQCWVVQLQSLCEGGGTIVEGSVSGYLTFDVAGHSPADLLPVIADARSRNAGIILRGFVGILSHFGDLLRREGIPSKIERPAQ